MSAWPGRTLMLLAVALLAACAASNAAPHPAEAPTTGVTGAQATPTTIGGTIPESTSAAATATPTLTAPGPAEQLAALGGTIPIDGSSTVFPITEAAATAFRSIAPEVEISLGVSGTSGGFKRFCTGETIISNASRPIKDSESDLCRAYGIAFVEIPVAYDGLSVVVNSANTWAHCLTTAELRRIWEPAAQGVITSWSDIRPEWADLPLDLYGAGGDSGTYDYFTAAVVGEEGKSRSDYTGSEDDYLIAQDVADNPGSLGFFGYAYVVEYEGRLRALAIDSGDGCISPSAATITSGAYQPLSRPIFIYVRADALARPEVAAFVRFYLANGPSLVDMAHYIPLPPRAYQLALARAERGLTGSVFAGGSQVGVSIEQLLELEGRQ